MALRQPDRFERDMMDRAAKFFELRNQTLNSQFVPYGYGNRFSDYDRAQPRFQQDQQFALDQIRTQNEPRMIDARTGQGTLDLARQRLAFDKSEAPLNREQAIRLQQVQNRGLIDAELAGRKPDQMEWKVENIGTDMEPQYVKIEKNSGQMMPIGNETAFYAKQYGLTPGMTGEQIMNVLGKLPP